MRYFIFILSILVGVGAGLYYSWVEKPVEFVDGTFSQLSPDYKTDYVLMVAEIFDKESSAKAGEYTASRQLDLIEESEPEITVLTAIDNAERLGYSDVDMEKMYKLYYALSKQGPTPTPETDPTLAAEIAMTATAQSALPTLTPTSDFTQAGAVIPSPEANPFSDQGVYMGSTAVPREDINSYDDFDYFFKD